MWKTSKHYQPPGQLMLAYMSAVHISQEWNFQCSMVNTKKLPWTSASLIIFSSRIEREMQWCSLTIWRLHIQNEIECIIVVGNLSAETTEIELIMNVLIIHLTEELIASQATEPGNPWSVLSIRSTHIWLLLAVCVWILCKKKSINSEKNLHYSSDCWYG